MKDYPVILEISKQRFAKNFQISKMRFTVKSGISATLKITEITDLGFFEIFFAGVKCNIIIQKSFFGIINNFKHYR